MNFSKNAFLNLTRAFALSLCTALLLSFVSCSDSTTSQEPKVKIVLDANGGSFSKTTDTTHTLVINKNQTSKLSTADELNLSYANHNFTGWAKSQQGTVEFNDGADITSSTDLKLYAQWEAVNTTYTVKHLLQNLADDYYTEDSTEEKSGTYGTQTAAEAKSYEGFTANPIEQKTIQADGQTFVEIKYDRNTYTVSYSSIYGEPPVSKTVRYGYELTAEDLPVLSKTGYNFNGWVYENTSIEAGYTVTGAITLTALWDEIIANYTVKHLLQNVQDDSYTEDSTEQKSGKSGTKTSAAAKTYEGFTAKPIEQETIQADGTTVVEIYYDRNTYTVSYSSTYGEPPVSKTVKYEYVLTAEDLPVLDDIMYNFNGWVYDGASIAAGYTVRKDITLTAQWHAVRSIYRVKHLLQNLADNDYTEDEDARETETGLIGTPTTASAKTYEGFTAKSFTQATIQADGSTVVEIYYDRNTYTVSYSSTYGEPPASKPVKYGYILTAADLPVLTQTNYSFNGWLFEGASISAGDIVKKDITLTALWDEIIASYTVKHLLQNLKDDNYTEDLTEQKSGKSSTQTAATAKTYDGFTAKTFAQKTIQDDGSTVVEIYYDRNTYTISYSSTYGEPPASKTVKYGYELTAEDLPVLTQNYYSFKGWFFDGASIATGDTVKKAITLTAQWEVAASTYFATKGNFSAVIRALPEDSTIVVTGKLTDSDLTAIENAINNSTYKVNLDLSQTTGLTSIPDSAFRECRKLSGITIPDSVTSIDYYAFYVCTSLSSVTIPDSVTSIGSQAFYWCESLSSVTIPDSVTSIGSYAFERCTSLSSVTIGNSVTYIGVSAFEGCTSLSSVTIPDSVTTIGDGAFRDCTSLSSVTVGESVTSIGEYAFYKCTSLSSVTIPDSVTSIDRYAFNGCSKLTSLTFTDPTTWYRTTSSTNWNNKTGGTLTGVTNPSTNATYFKSTYTGYYWYKL